MDKDMGQKGAAKIVQNTTQKGAVIWLMGLAGSGKSTLCAALCEKIRQTHKNLVYLDGDEMRELLSSFGYERDARIRTGQQYFTFAKFLSNQGINVVVGAIGMFSEMYEFNRQILQNYVEVYIKCDFEELVRRDKKGLYSGALKREVTNVVGVDIAYDTPNPALIIDNSKANNLESKVNTIYEKIKGNLC